MSATHPLQFNDAEFATEVAESATREAHHSPAQNKDNATHAAESGLPTLVAKIPEIPVFP